MAPPLNMRPQPGTAEVEERPSIAAASWLRLKWFCQSPGKVARVSIRFLGETFVSGGIIWAFAGPSGNTSIKVGVGAGVQATSKGLSWLFGLIGQNDDAQDKLVEQSLTKVANRPKAQSLGSKGDQAEGASKLPDGFMDSYSSMSKIREIILPVAGSVTAGGVTAGGILFFAPETYTDYAALAAVSAFAGEAVGTGLREARECQLQSNIFKRCGK